MAYEIFDCSPQAALMIKQRTSQALVFKNEHHRMKYPFDEMLIGQSFSVPINEALEGSLRQTAIRRGKQYSKRFTVIKHKDFGVFEVARVG